MSSPMLPQASSDLLRPTFTQSYVVPGLLRGYRGEDREEGLEVTEEACEEDERCEEDSECHSAAKRARVCATFTDRQENAIVEFVKEHPELYNKEHGRFHDRHRGRRLSGQKSLQN